MDSRHRMSLDTRQLLAYIVANPGVCGTQLRALFGGGLRTKKRLDSLLKCHNAYTERTPGVLVRRWYPTRGGEAVVQGRLDYMPRELRAQPVLRNLVPARECVFRPWPEPYLSDAGIRRSGLEYRNCASLRGTRRVYCWRLDALQ